MVNIQHDVKLSPYTTVGLGGNARFFAACSTVEQIRECLEFAHQRRLPVHVLGGGSNTIFSDEGYEGLVLRVAMRGIRVSGEAADIITAAAGEPWDDLVQQSIRLNLEGLECLSGIPGLTGGTPIQNVGAYGQEVSETIVRVEALDRQGIRTVAFTNTECRFGYRRSRFNGEDSNRFIITEVTYQLRPLGEPCLTYPELRQQIGGDMKSFAPGAPQLGAVRSAVLALRKSKSMVIDPADPNSRSVGSFFKNPVLPLSRFAEVERCWREGGNRTPVPTFASGDAVKIPAAWLVEKAGFTKGLRKGGVGISARHSLALVNYSGTTRELLQLAAEIQTTVYQKFGVTLEREPVVVEVSHTE